MKKLIYLIGLSFLFLTACESQTEIINREILVKDTVVVDRDADALGGVAINFMFCSEYMTNEDTLLPGTEVRVVLADTTLIGTPDEDGIIKIKGLEAGKVYGAEIYHKGVYYGLIRVGPAGANIYVDNTPDFPIIDQSNTVLESVVQRLEKDSAGQLNVFISSKLSDQGGTLLFKDRGALVCLSKGVEPDLYEADLYSRNVIVDPQNNSVDSVINGISELQMQNAGFEKGDMVYYRVYGASRDRTATTVNEISRYFRPQYLAISGSEYVNVNPDYMEGSFVWEE